jgi:hypothetical protein
VMVLRVHAFGLNPSVHKNLQINVKFVTKRQCFRCADYTLDLRRPNCQEYKHTGQWLRNIHPTLVDLVPKNDTKHRK